MQRELEELVRKKLLEEKVSNEHNVDIFLKILELRAKKFDRCGSPKCNHEHVILELVEDLISRLNIVRKSQKSRIEMEKEALLKRGFKVREIRKGG